GPVNRRIGRCRNDASPVKVAGNFWPAKTPRTIRAVVPEFPQFKREPGARSREPEILTPDSWIREMSAPNWRRTLALLFTSSPVSKPAISLVPRASAASMSTRCEMLLSPGGRTTPAMRCGLEATPAPADPSPPGRCPGQPRRQGACVADLERPLDGAE